MRYCYDHGSVYNDIRHYERTVVIVTEMSSAAERYLRGIPWNFSGSIAHDLLRNLLVVLVHDRYSRE